jgi:acetyltransferase-like isoleucine patch superfamily enzyme
MKEVNHALKMGKNCDVASSAHIADNVILGDNVTIFPNVYLGSNVKIGDGTTIQYGAFIEHECKIGCNSRVGTNAVLRRETIIGDNSIFGSLSASEGKNWIGNNVLIHSQNHITTGLVIEDYVFIAPEFVGANDPDMLHARRHVKTFVPQAPYIEFGARIAVNVTVLPNVRIGREAVIGAASVVTKNIPAFSIAYGSPARVKLKIEDRWRLPERLYEEFRKRVSQQFLDRINKC